MTPQVRQASGSVAALALRSTVAGTSTAPRTRLTDKPPLVARLHVPGGVVVIETPRPEPTWLRPTLLAFQRIVELEDGWDSYGNARPSDVAIVQALLALDNLLGQESPSPEVVPTSSGAVQLEWHEGGMDLEVIVSRAGVLSAYYHQAIDGTEWGIERVSSGDFPKLAAILAAL